MLANTNTDRCTNDLEMGGLKAGLMRFQLRRGEPTGEPVVISGWRVALTKLPVSLRHLRATPRVTFPSAEPTRLPFQRRLTASTHMPIILIVYVVSNETATQTRLS